VDADPPDTPPRVTVTVTDEQDVEVDQARIVDVAVRTAAAERGSGEISITLVAPGRIAELNEQYLGQEGPTDVLSFPIDGPDSIVVEESSADAGPPRLIGEIVICPAVAARQAPSGLDAELDLLTAHGVLHLLGYDHDTEDRAAEMRQREELLTGQSGARAS
jgi:probable rRNA maturation factor